MLENAIILCAGQGRRMGGLTKDVPKPMVKVGSQTLLEWQIANLVRLKFKRIFINTFIHAGTLEEFIRSRKWPVEIFFRRENSLLGTAGGITTLVHHFDELQRSKHFLVCNVDTFLDLKDQEFYDPKWENRTCVMYATSPLSTPDNHRYNRLIVQNEELESIATLRDLNQGLIYTGLMLARPKEFLQMPADTLLELGRDYWLKNRCHVHLVREKWWDLGEEELLAKHGTAFLESRR